MTYKAGDLLYHEHEHGPECPQRPPDLPSTAVDANEFLRMHRERNEAFSAHVRHLSEFSTSTFRTAVLVADNDLTEEGRYEIGGPVEVRALIGDLRSLLDRMDPPAFSEILKEVADDAALIARINGEDRDIVAQNLELRTEVARFKMEAAIIEADLARAHPELRPEIKARFNTLFGKAERL